MFINSLPPFIQHLNAFSLEINPKRLTIPSQMRATKLKKSIWSAASIYRRKSNFKHNLIHSSQKNTWKMYYKKVYLIEFPIYLAKNTRNRVIFHNFKFVHLFHLFQLYHLFHFYSSAHPFINRQNKLRCLQKSKDSHELDKLEILK